MPEFIKIYCYIKLRNCKMLENTSKQLRVAGKLHGFPLPVMEL